MRFAPLFCIALAAWVAGASRAQGQAHCPTCVVPDSIGPLRLVGWERFPQASAGDAFRYRQRGNWGADVFIYPADSVFSPADELRTFRETLDTLVQRGQFDSARVVTEGTSPIQPAATGVQVIAAIHSKDRHARTFFFLAPIEHSRVKVRVTVPEGSVPDEQVLAFVRALYPEVARRLRP
jgi:hypothetical protein